VILDRSSGRMSVPAIRWVRRHLGVATRPPAMEQVATLEGHLVKKQDTTHALWLRLGAAAG